MTRSKATEKTDWPKELGKETPVKKKQRSASPSPVSTPAPDYERPKLPPRNKDGKFRKTASILVSLITTL